MPVAGPEQVEELSVVHVPTYPGPQDRPAVEWVVADYGGMVGEFGIVADTESLVALRVEPFGWAGVGVCGCS